MSIVREDLVREAEVRMLEARSGPQSVVEKRLLATRRYLLDAMKKVARGDESPFYLDDVLEDLGA